MRESRIERLEMVAYRAMASKLEEARGRIECMPVSSAATDSERRPIRRRERTGETMRFAIDCTEGLDTRHDVGYERRETRVSISARYAAPLWNAHLLTFVAACLAKPRTRSSPGKHASWTRFPLGIVRGCCPSADDDRAILTLLFQNLPFEDNCLRLVPFRYSNLEF